ncbi:hypothetical protein AB0L88_42120 [Saccharopolyspora shandongensis]|uniref:Uncharacterized protein n=1 Tax=Saccharopolyspora shandongensis TaxID=418495 RepID=A0A1H3QPB3_9PSEU|nr:hypothetical protein [Saccharopolyspora shandongensis]SDZ15394.1 hypothetical protein SAMN05216215_10498 [Saccharopolyspora shandongensis]
MAVPDPDGRGAPSWPTNGENLKADPSSLRGYGTNVATIGKNLQSDTMGGAMNINGVGDDISISTGGFPEGEQADQLMARNAQEMMRFLQDIRQNHLAISSVAHICADLYEDTDAANGVRLSGVEWAFHEPGAERPPGAPPYLKETIADNMADAPKGLGKLGDEKLTGTHHFSGGVVYMYESKDGRTRSVVQTEGGITETGYDKNGNETYSTTSKPSGVMITKTYGENGKVVSTTNRSVESRKIAGGRDEVTTVRTEQAGKKETVVEEHKVTRKYEDGTESHHYYKEEEGKRSDERYIGRQPKRVTPEDWADEARRTMKENRRMAGGM